MTPRAICFDLGNTLVSYYHKEHFLPVLEQSIQHCLALLANKGLSFDFGHSMELAIAQDPGRPDHKVTPIKHRLTAIFGDAVVNEHNAELIKAFMDPVFATARVMQGTVELLQGLAAGKAPLVLVSNTPWGSPSTLWRKHLVNIGIGHFFDHQVYCVDVGWRKPHAAIFNHALEKLALPASDVLFVGDDREWDMKGARDAGMDFLHADGEHHQRLMNLLLKSSSKT